VLAALALALPFPAHGAADADGAGPPLDLQEAVTRSLAHNKQLAAFGFRLQEQDGRVEQAGLLPNPELGLKVEDAAGSGKQEKFDRAETTLSLEWALDPTRPGRAEAAEMGAALIRKDAEILRLDVAAETARRFLSGLANQARLENADEAVSLAESTVSAVTRRVRAGRSPGAELDRAEASLAMAQLARDDVTHELSIAYHRLAAQWGSTDPGFTRVTGNLLKLPTTEPLAILRERVDRSPKLARFASEERLARANLRLAEARRWPTLRPGVGVRRYEDGNDYGIVAGIRVSLPVLDRSQGRLSESRAALSRTRAEEEAARVEALTLLFELHEELQHFLHRTATLRDEVIPRLAKALSATRRGYEQGRYSYFEWHAVQTDLLDAKAELVEASAGVHRLVIALEALTGERVVKS